MADDRRDDAPEYEALLLDFGGVCLLNPVELHSHTEQTLGLGPGSLTWKGPIDPTTDGLWRRMVAGDGVTERDYWATRAEEVGRAAGREFDVRDYMRLLYEPPRPELVRAEAWSVVEAARAVGLGVSLLTNDMRAFHGRDWEAGIDFLGLMDHIVDCSDTNILKPDPRAFARAIEIIGVPAERTLFVDDQPLNVDGAVQAGFDALWFDVADAAGSWAEVGRRLGLG